MPDATIYLSSPFDVNALIIIEKNKHEMGSMSWTRHDLLIDTPSKIYNLKAVVSSKRLYGVGLLPGARAGLSGATIALKNISPNSGGETTFIAAGTNADTLFPVSSDERLFVEFDHTLQGRNEISLDFHSGTYQTPFTISMYLLTE
ncbi:MAG: hypothetical protein NTY96_00280 [Bacteroidetes bacterium]|nr:hypothetical protein [Bacteroidota bacterium]